MKATIFVLLAFLLATATAHAAQEAHTITIDLKDASLPDALDQIQKASGIRLAYSQELVADAERVTLKAEDEPVDEVLRRILRPRGLEFIYTGENVAAIVRADSDMGMAKAAGRAIRSLAKLARKIESARQEGDEIIMPEWMDEDDRALAEALADLYRTMNWFSERSRRSYGTRLVAVKKCERVLGLLECSNLTVRIGAAAVVRWMRCRPKNDGQKQRLSMSLAKMAGDPDPLLRGAAIVISARTQYSSASKARSALEQELRQAAVDEEPEVRFAAALGILQYPYVNFELDKEILRGLRKDPHAAVRAVAWLGPSLYREIRQPDLSTVSEGLRDSNPIVRTICLDHMGRLLHCDYAKRYASRSHVGGAKVAADLLREDLEKLQVAMKAEGVENDPWLKIAAEAVIARSAANWCSDLRVQVMINSPDGTGEIPQSLVQMQEKANATIDGLLASGKRCQAMLACWTLMHAWSSAWFFGSTLFRLDAVHAESPHVPTRLIGIAACGVAEPEARGTRLLQALDSADELERLAGLWGCWIALPRPAAPALREPLIALMRRGRRYESRLAARTLGSILPFEEILPLLLEECRRQPGSSAARHILNSMFSFRVLSTAPANLMLLLDAVLETQDATLQEDFFDHLSGSALLRLHQPLLHQPLLLTYIIESDLEAFYRLLESHSNVFSEGRRPDSTPKAYAVNALLKRLEGLICGPDGKLNLRAVSAFESFFGVGNVRLTAAQTRNLFETIAPCMQACFRPDASEAQVAGGGKMVQTIIWRVKRRVNDTRTTTMNWRDLPPAMRDACRIFLGYATHKVHGPQVAAVLVDCHYRLTGLPPREVEPEMLEAIDKGGAAIMERGSATDQVRLLVSTARTADEPARAKAAVELQRRLLAGEVPSKQRWRSFYAVSLRPELLTPEFIRFLFERIGDPKEENIVRQRAIGALGGRPEVFEALVPFFGKLLEADPDARCFWKAIQELESELQRLSEEKLPPPPWAKAAADLAIKAARSASRRPIGEKAIQLYAVAAGAESAPRLEAMAQDEELSPYVRAAAARFAVEVNPKTKLLTTFAASYTKLPPEMREGLAKCAARARETPGAEAFFLRCLRDLDIGEQRERALRALKLPLTPTLMAALKKLETDPILGYQVKKKIERLQNPRK